MKMGIFDMNAEKKRDPPLKKGDRFRKKAIISADKNDDAHASELYFLAAEHYAKAGEKYWAGHCESWAWSLKAKSMGTGLEDSIKSARYYDLAIQADNRTLFVISEDDPHHSVTEGNMRFTEGDKYTALANSEVERANPSYGREKSEHLQRAAEYRLSGAQTMKLAAGLSKKEGNMEGYYNRLGIYYRDRSGYHYYRGSGEKERNNWNIALEEFEEAAKERKLAIALHRRSLRIRSDKNVKNNLKQDKKMLRALKREISKVRKEAKLERKRLISASAAGTPELNIGIRAVEGMMQNLVSTLSVDICNFGDGDAKLIQLMLASSFLEGEKSARINKLGPNKRTNVGLSVVPTKAGSPKAKVIISYSDGLGKKYLQKTMITLKVGDPEDKRPPPTTIYNVQGDLLGEGASKVDIRDSVVQRSRIGRFN